MRFASYHTKKEVRVAAIFAIALLALTETTKKTVAASETVVLSFGSNSSGQTGQGIDNGDTILATPIDTTNLMGETITGIATGDSSLLVSQDGTVFSFGSNYEGSTGLGTDVGSTLVATPINTTNLAGKTITQAASGGEFGLLLASDGTVFSFGNNHNGRTGLGIQPLSGFPETENTLVATPIDTTHLAGKTITQVSAGGYHGLLLADDGSVFSFGDNQFTGQGTILNSTLVATQIDMTNLEGKKITQVAAGERHNLLLADDGTVFAFGENTWGQAGLGTSLGSLIAAPIDATNLAGRTITQVAAGRFHSLLLADDGSVFSVGWNDLGRTGQGTAAGITLVPELIDSTNVASKKITKVAAGGRSSLLLADDGTVFSFGDNRSGITGLGFDSYSETTVATPIDTTNLAGLRVVDITASLLLAEQVPEPGAMTLLMLGGLSCLVAGRSRRSPSTKSCLPPIISCVAYATPMITVALTACVFCATGVQAARPDNPGGGNSGGSGNGGAAYSIVPFLPPVFDRATPEGLNEMGSAVGEAEISGDMSQAVHYDIDAGKYTTLDGGSFSSSYAHGINNLNQVVGSGGDGNGNDVGLFWSSLTASPTVLAPLPGDTRSYARAINDSGFVVGASIDSDDNWRGLVWHATAGDGGTVLVDDPVVLPPLPGGDSSWIVDVTEVSEGSVVVSGTTAFAAPAQEATIWLLDVNPDGTVADVSPPVGLGTLDGTVSKSFGGNNLGDVVGSYAKLDGYSFPMFAPFGETIQPLPVVSDTVSGEAASINDLGEIVGTLRITNKKYRYSSTPHAYLWKDGEAIDLEKQIPGNSGWDLLQDVWVINNAGVIGGWGSFNGVGGQGFLMVPSALSSASATSIPEPSALTLTAVALFGILSRKRRTTLSD